MDNQKNINLNFSVLNLHALTNDEIEIAEMKLSELKSKYNNLHMKISND